MANYGRDTGKKYGTAGDLGKLGVLLGTGCAVLNMYQTGRNNSRKLDLQNQISSCDRQIDDLKSGLLGEWLNSAQIATLKKKRAELQNKYNSI